MKMECACRVNSDTHYRLTGPFSAVSSMHFHDLPGASVADGLECSAS